MDHPHRWLSVICCCVGPFMVRAPRFFVLRTSQSSILVFRQQQDMFRFDLADWDGVWLGSTPATSATLISRIAEDYSVLVEMVIVQTCEPDSPSNYIFIGCNSCSRSAKATKSCSSGTPAQSSSAGGCLRATDSQSVWQVRDIWPTMTSFRPPVVA